MEVVRSIVAGPTAGDRELRLDARTYGFRSLPGPSQARSGNNRMKFRRANIDLVRAMRATVKVNSATAVNCPTAGAEITQARFRMGGFFFNAGVAPEPGRGTDDIGARVEVRRLSNAPANQLNVRAVVLRCLDPDCLTSQTLFTQTLATVLVGQTHIYLLQWDPPTNRFLFRLDALPTVIFNYGALPDSLPAQNFFDTKKAIELNHFVANCQAVQTHAFMSVNVDDVLLNTAAAIAPASPLARDPEASEASEDSADEGRIPGEPEIPESDE